METIRFGRAVRALRQRRAWRQDDLARVVGVSQSAISRAELGQADRLTVRALESIAHALGARVDVRLTWQGAAVDRVVEAGHASLVEEIVRRLRSGGWETAVDVTFVIGGERGSIDVLGWRRPTELLLVAEIKTAFGDIQATVATLDRKVRLAPRIARSRGWAPTTVSRILVLPEQRAARRIVAQHRTMFESAFPARGSQVLAWLRAPGRHAISGLVFLTTTHQAGGSQRRTPFRQRVRHIPRSAGGRTAR
jgi:transcriptional regulator with XRE-family HTH domain